MSLSLNDIICFVAHDAMMEEHSFHCYKLVISFNGTYTATLDGTTLHQLTGHVLNRNINHLCQAPGTSALIYLIEIESPLGVAVRQLLDGQPYQNLSAMLHTPAFMELLAQGPEAVQQAALPTFAYQVLLGLFPILDELPTPVRDQRVDQMLDYIDTYIQEPLVLKPIADQVNLSTERARHLFEAQIGAPFSQFVLWKRVRRVVQTVAMEEMELPQAIHHYGFFDQTHFCRNFKRMFGAKPTYFLKHNPCISLSEFA